MSVVLRTIAFMNARTVLQVPRGPFADAPLWRVLGSDGRLLGYVDGVAVDEGLRYRARRRLTHRGVEVETGRFWGFDDAVSSLV